MNLSQSTNDRNFGQIAGYLFVIVSCLFLSLRGAYHLETSALAAGDFQTIYGMTRCMVDHCDPYDGDQVRMAFTRNGGVVKDPYPFKKHEPLYFPSALTLTLPFALLTWKLARLLWMLALIGSFTTAVLLIARLCSPHSPLLSMLCLGLLVITSMPLILVAQPAMLVIGLGGVAVWCFVEKKAEAVGVCCMAASLAYKPHVIGLVWLYFLLRSGRYRKRALQSLVLTLVVAGISILWAASAPRTAHWLAGMRANIAGTAGAGGVADPGPHNPEPWGASSEPNLQTIYSLFDDRPPVYNALSYATVAVLFAAWLYLVIRTPAGRRKDYFAIASAACICLLPTYHQECDTRLLLLTFPALACTLGTNPRLRTFLFSVNFAGLFLIGKKYQALMFEHVIGKRLPLGRWATIVLLRQLPLVMLGLAILWLILFSQLSARASIEDCAG